MGNRTIERAVARRLYADFSKAWRREKRLAGKYGEPGFRKPTFAQWYLIHGHDQEMMATSTPQDVQEYLGVDPWDLRKPTPADVVSEEIERKSEERGVAEIPLFGDAPSSMTSDIGGDDI